MPSSPRTFNNWLIVGILLLVLGGATLGLSWTGLALIALIMGSAVTVTGAYQGWFSGQL
jgi:hypothetical protein